MNAEQKKWDDFIIRHGGSFLQSLNWGEFQETFGRRVWRLGGEGQGWRAQVFEYALPFGLKYLYVPRGPVIDSKNDSSKVFHGALSMIKSLAKEQKAVFIKIEPEALSAELTEVLSESAYQISPKEIQPRSTVILDLNLSEEDLQANLKSKTRYNIRLAIKHRVKVRPGVTESDFQGFWRLIEETAKRQGFKTHSKKYYRDMIKTGAVELFLAEHGHKAGGRGEFKAPGVVAAALVNFFGDRATYLHGASSHEHRQLMAPYVLHWWIIREAKRRALSEYDFWGVDQKRWPGFTRFKTGWGGHNMESAGAWDFPIREGWYRAYSLFSKIKSHV